MNTVFKARDLELPSGAKIDVFLSFNQITKRRLPGQTEGTSSGLNSGQTEVSAVTQPRLLMTLRFGGSTRMDPIDLKATVKMSKAIERHDREESRFPRVL